MKFSTHSRYDIDLIAGVSIPLAVAPFGYLFGSLFLTHVVSSEARAVWLSTVALTAIAVVVYGLVTGADG